MIKSSSNFTPDFIESLGENEVFVFGSNLNGVHAGGASLMALRNFGAEWGQAEGPQGQSYAIPTDIRGEAVDNVSAYLKKHIDTFIAYAKDHPDKIFFVTKVGCGNAGFDEEFIAPFFKEALNLKNVRLPREFVDILSAKEDAEDDGTQRIYNLIILDESGSMQTIEKQAVSGLNETFQTILKAQKEHEEQQHYISFVTFNSKAIKTVFDRRTVNPSEKIEWFDYNPNDCTPLFDAMGESINKLKRHVKDKDVVLVTIITDGYENASKKYSGKDIKNLVGELKKNGWLFVYIGTNQDVDAVADDMGIRSRMNYEYSDRGASDMFMAERSSKEIFYERLHRKGRKFLMEDSYDYFNPGDEDAVDTPKEAEKEPDIVWDTNNDEPQVTEENHQKEESCQTNPELDHAKIDQKKSNKSVIMLCIICMILMAVSTLLLLTR